MDINKENRITKMRSTSKIPLPQDPLPKIPNKLLNKKEVRHPLKNINGIETTNTNVASVVDRKCPLKIDVTHVTVRKTEDLDWEYRVFRDEKFALSSLPDAGTSGCQEVEITPLKSPLAVNRIKNIKRSLKRPHSRELQGLSPEPSKKKEGNFKRRLDFKTGNERMHLPDSLSGNHVTSLTEDYTEDVFVYLLSAERRGELPQIGRLPRACVVNWIIKVNGNHGNPAVIQSALSHMDALLAMMQVDVDHLQLVAAACYWIAQKSAGPFISARKLVKASSHAFSVSKLVRAERTILRTLRFPTTPVVPQDFISYLSWTCELSKPGEVEAAATFICISALMTAKSLCNEYPSVMGAAAVGNAMLLLDRNLETLQDNDVYRVAVSKAQDFAYVCWAQKKAVYEVSSPQWKFKAPLDKYGTQFVAQRIVNAPTGKHEALHNS